MQVYIYYVMFFILIKDKKLKNALFIVLIFEKP